MPLLKEVLTLPEKRVAVVEDCLEVIDAEVADKGGLSGLAIKAGYSAVKSVKPGFLKNVVSDLLPEFADALEPLCKEAKEGGKGISDFFNQNASRVADALLGITDGKAERAKSAVVKGTYSKLRGSAKKNVEAAVPRLGKLVQKHAG